MEASRGGAENDSSITDRSQTHRSDTAAREHPGLPPNCRVSTLCSLKSAERVRVVRGKNALPGDLRGRQVFASTASGMSSLGKPCAAPINSAITRRRSSAEQHSHWISPRCGCEDAHPDFLDRHIVRPEGENSRRYPGRACVTAVVMVQWMATCCLEYCAESCRRLPACDARRGPAVTHPPTRSPANSGWKPTPAKSAGTRWSPPVRVSHVVRVAAAAHPARDSAPEDRLRRSRDVRLMLIHQREHAANQLFAAEVGQTAQVGGPQMRVFIGVAARTAQRTFASDFYGKGWNSTNKNTAPGLKNRFDLQ